MGVMLRMVGVGSVMESWGIDRPVIRSLGQFSLFRDRLSVRGQPLAGLETSCTVRGAREVRPLTHCTGWCMSGSWDSSCRSGSIAKGGGICSDMHLSGARLASTPCMPPFCDEKACTDTSCHVSQPGDAVAVEQDLCLVGGIQIYLAPRIGKPGL